MVILSSEEQDGFGKGFSLLTCVISNNARLHVESCCNQQLVLPLFDRDNRSRNAQRRVSPLEKLVTEVNQDGRAAPVCISLDVKVVRVPP